MNKLLRYVSLTLIFISILNCTAFAQDKPVKSEAEIYRLLENSLKTIFDDHAYELAIECAMETDSKERGYRDIYYIYSSVFAVQNENLDYILKVTGDSNYYDSIIGIESNIDGVMETLFYEKDNWNMREDDDDLILEYFYTSLYPIMMVLELATGFDWNYYDSGSNLSILKEYGEIQEEIIEDEYYYLYKLNIDHNAFQDLYENSYWFYYNNYDLYAQFEAEVLIHAETGTLHGLQCNVLIDMQIPSVNRFVTDKITYFGEYTYKSIGSGTIISLNQYLD